MKNTQFLAHKVFVFTLVSILMVTFGSLNISFAQEDTQSISDDTVLTGPWLWMVAPTGAEGEANEISPEIDSLAAASDGAVTETHIAENGANEGDIVGDWRWIDGLLTPSDTDKRKYCGAGPAVIFLQLECKNVYWQNNLNDTLKHLGFSTGDDMVGNTAYALIYLVSPQNQSGTMHIESGDAVKVWLNGEVVHRQAATHLPPRNIDISFAVDPHTSVPDPRTWESETVSFPVTLKAGNNLLLVKVRQAGNYWDMRVQVDADFITAPSTDKIPPLIISIPPFALTEKTLDGSVFTLWLTDNTFARDISEISEAVSVSGIPGVTIKADSVQRVSDAEVSFELAFEGDFDTDTPLTFSVGAGAIANYTGDAFTYQTGYIHGIMETGSAFSPVPLREATLDGSVITLTLTGVTFEPDISKIREAVSVSGAQGVSVKAARVQRINDFKIKVELDFDGTGFAVEKLLIFSVGAGALVNYTGDALTTGGIRVTPAREGQVSIYWTTSGTIKRAKTDGSNVEDLVTGLGYPHGIALDVAGGKMYFGDGRTDKIQRADLDGSNVEDLVTTGVPWVTGIALDVAGGKMYWTDTWAYRIQRANLDGSNVETLVTGRDLVKGSHSIALDVAGGKIYWTHEVSKVIRRANLDGSNVETLRRSVRVSDIALDVVGGKMYSAEQYPAKVIRCANLDGSNVETLVTLKGRVPLDIALDVAGGKMYWTDADSRSEKIRCANLDGSNVETLFTVAEGSRDIAIGISPVSAAIVKEDVNRDGVVDAEDLVYISRRYGQTGERSADVNADGVVNIEDLILVAAVIDAAAAAAPVARSKRPKGLTLANVQQWLTEAKLTGKTTPTYQRGIRMLEQLLAALTPKETALLANYPNPFNPETWIPYQLTDPADVTLTIYAVNGQVVRTLRLGHQPAGMYQSRSRAAYWDGRNAVGEKVASGVYFYTLTAGEFTATRKMLVMK